MRFPISCIYYASFNLIWSSLKNIIAYIFYRTQSFYSKFEENEDAELSVTIVFALTQFSNLFSLIFLFEIITRESLNLQKYVYASIAIFFLISYYLDRAIKSVKYKNVAILSFTVYILYLGLYTTQHAKVWHDTGSLKKEVNDLFKKRNDFENKHKKKWHQPVWL